MSSCSIAGLSPFQIQGRERQWESKVAYPGTCHNDAKLKTGLLSLKLNIVKLQCIRTVKPQKRGQQRDMKSVLINDISYMQYGNPRQANKQEEHLLESPVECG